MNFEIYCDESSPDLFASQKRTCKYLTIGGIWFPHEKREEFKTAIHALRDRHRIGPEFKWNKVSPSKLDFYRDLLQWFIEEKDFIRFRCILVEADKVQLLKYHCSDQELGFYKFYYQLLHHWIYDFNQYKIFLDHRKNRLQSRLLTLQQCLVSSNLSSEITSVQAIQSSESVLIQLADVLTGLCAAKFNQGTKEGSAKTQLLQFFEERLGRQIVPTTSDEKKVNVFRINLDGGW